MKIINCLLLSMLGFLPSHAEIAQTDKYMQDATANVQCALKGAIFGHSWQRHQEGVSKTEIIEQLVIKLNEDGAPPHYINIWVEQMDASLNITDYYVMVGEIVYQCLQHGGV